MWKLNKQIPPHTLLWMKNLKCYFFVLAVEEKNGENAKGQDNSPSDGKMLLTTTQPLAVQKRIRTQSLHLHFFCFLALMSNGSPLLDLVEGTLWITSCASPRWADVQLMVSTCSLGVKTLPICWCSSSWQFPGICRYATSAHGWRSLVDLNQPLREVFQIRTFQTDNPNAHSQRLLHGCGLWLPHHLICCWEWAGALQQAGVSRSKSVKAFQKQIFDFSLMKHFLSMPNGMIEAQSKHLLQMEASSRDNEHHYQIIGFLFLCSDDFSFIFSQTLTAELFLSRGFLSLPPSSRLGKTIGWHCRCTYLQTPRSFVCVLNERSFNCQRMSTGGICMSHK